MLVGLTRRLGSLLLLLGCAQCGGRSSLLAAGDDAYGAGGAGGSSVRDDREEIPFECTPWEITTNFTLNAFSDERAFLPRLVPIEEDESRFAFTFVGQTGEAGPLRLWHTGLSPWDQPNNSSKVLNGTFLYHLPSLDYAVASSTKEGAYSLLLGVEQPKGLDLGLSLTPGASEPGDVLSLPSQTSSDTRPLFLARRKKSSPAVIEHLAGYEQRVGERRRLLVRIVSATWGQVEHSQAIACANGPIAASAKGFQDLFFLAAASSRALSSCEEPKDPFGAPKRMNVFSYRAPLGQVLSPMATWDETAPIEAVDLVVGQGSVWIAYATRLSDTQARLFLAHVGFDGNLKGTPMRLADVPRPLSFSLAWMGNRLVLASRDQTPAGQPTVVVRVFHSDGKGMKIFTIVPAAAADVAIAGEPSGDRLLVALTQRQPSSPLSAVTLARYSCP